MTDPSPDDTLHCAVCLYKFFFRIIPKEEHGSLIVTWTIRPHITKHRFSLHIPSLFRIVRPFDASRTKPLTDDVPDCLTAADPKPVLALKAGAKRVQRGDLRWTELQVYVDGI